MRLQAPIRGETEADAGAIAEVTGALSRQEAARILAQHGGGAPWTRHCLAVAEAAARVGRALEAVREVDLDLLWSTALLHDVGRCVTHDPILHGVEGYRLLTELGHHEAAFVCASHVLFGLEAAEAAGFGLPVRDFVPLTYEQRIVPLVDYLVESERPTTLESRFSSLRVRNAGDGRFLARLERAYGAARGFLEGLGDEIGRPVEEVVASAGRP